MARTRSYDIELAESANEDLDNAGDDAAGLTEAIVGLDDEHIHSWEELPLPRGDEGSWVVFRLCGRWVMAQWDKGNPSLWFLGESYRASRGFLKLVRIVPPEELAAAMGELEKQRGK